MGKILLALPILLAFALIIVATVIPSINTVTSNDAFMTYHSRVCISKNGHLLQCSPNVFSNAGKNLTRDYIGNFTSTDAGRVKYIALGNGSAGATATGLTYEVLTADCSGLGRAEGTYAVTLGSAGNWTIAKKFTCGCTSFNVNSTGLYNNSGAGQAVYFAGNNFTNVPLSQNDEITVTWYIWVTEG